jgi:hypothetical protein
MLQPTVSVNSIYWNCGGAVLFNYISLDMVQVVEQLPFSVLGDNLLTIWVKNVPDRF